METQYPLKEEEENAMHNTVVIFSSNDSFTLKQVCMCAHLFCAHSDFNLKFLTMNFSIHAKWPHNKLFA